jgi:hypothetical protein
MILPLRNEERLIDIDPTSIAVISPSDLLTCSDHAAHIVRRIFECIIR